MRVLVNRTSEFFHTNQIAINATKSKWNFWIRVFLLCIPCTVCDAAKYTSAICRMALFWSWIHVESTKWKITEIHSAQCSVLSAQHPIIYYNIVDENCYDKENVFYLTNWITIDLMLRTLRQHSIEALGIGLVSTWSILLKRLRLHDQWPTATIKTTTKIKYKLNAQR